jgi:hypothetical protein
MPIPLTATLAQDQKNAMDQARAMMDKENHGATTLSTQDSGPDPGYLVYVYNILEREWIVEQPPLFPSFHIPAREAAKKFSVTVLPAFVNEVHQKAGSTELSYKRVDGRKCATSLLNPGAFPGTNWAGQLHTWKTDDQYGNNLNKYGCFWSLTTPDQTEKLDEEIKLFKNRVRETATELVKAAEVHAAQQDFRGISPLMHWAMDYLGKSAPWHMTMYHMISCPNCGEQVMDGISYHKNAFGEKCVIDMERYMASVIVERPRKRTEEVIEEMSEEPVVAAPAPRRIKKKI